jgi:purine-cytosine permease-like protein
MAIRALGLGKRPAAATAGELAAPSRYGPATLAMLFGGLSMSLLAFVPGAYLVPALTLRDAVLVALAGGVLGGTMLGAVGAVAAQRRQNTIGLLSGVLGMGSAPLLAALLFARHVVWALFMLAFASEVAVHVPGAGDSATTWIIAVAALALALALVPAQVFVGRWMAWFAFWVGLLIVFAITATGITSYGVPVLHDANGLGGWPSRAQGFDLVAAVPLLWLPIVADYTMDARRPRDAALGTGIGAGAMTAWYAVVGILWVFTVSARDVAGFITALPLGAGGLVILVALEADAVAANLRAASLAGGRFGYRWFTPTLIAAAALAAALAVALDGFELEDALTAIGAAVVPLFAVVLARAALGPAHRAWAWCGWLAGALAYGWVNPGGFGPWRDAMEFVFATVLRLPFPLGGETSPIPGTLLAAAAAAAVYAAGAQLARKGGARHG